VSNSIVLDISIREFIKVLSSKPNITKEEFIWQAKLKLRINPSLHV